MHVPLDERVASWFASAESDIRVATEIRSLASHLACFHAQQGAEKALKAVLTRLAGDAPPLHAMVRLLAALDELSEAVPAEIRSEAESLDKFYVPPRYPDALGFIDASSAYKTRDADAAIEGAGAVLAWAHERDAELRSTEHER